MDRPNPFNQNLEKVEANHQPLTPLLFLERAAQAYPDKTAIVHQEITLSYRQFYQQSTQMASALVKLGIRRGEVVSTMLTNTPPMLFAHYGVPMSGGVLHPINVRLDAAMIAFQLEHAQSKVLIYDSTYAGVVQDALAIIGITPLLIEYTDPTVNGEPSTSDSIGFEAFLNRGDEAFQWLMPEDEWDAISLNYTSGTTGDPKGVVLHHRGAYLLATSNVLAAHMQSHATYLWTLPMFHCNGWCFPWTLSLIAGKHVCLRSVQSELIWQAIEAHDVTHLCGAPIVMSVVLEAEKRNKGKEIRFLTAAAPPPESVLANMKKSGFSIVHVYGLTEVYGPAVVNEWHSEWSDLPLEEQARLKARQGLRYAALESLAVLDPNTMEPVPKDGKTIGEVMFRGNVVMKGYFKNPEATKKAFEGGWFHSGDLGVQYPDGYVQLKDRSKDIIISGGENISSIEVEDALYKHPDVTAAAVVALTDEKWGEVPCAFVETQSTSDLTEHDLMEWCRNHLAGFKRPKKIIFSQLPKTNTGKIQKHALRQRLRES